jgi:hypothetical protein
MTQPGFKKKMNKTVVDKGFKGNKTRNNKLVGVIMQLNV